MRKIWTDEDIERAEDLKKIYSATQVGHIFGTTKNSILGVLYRKKIKEGYIPPVDSKYTGKKENYPKHLVRRIENE